MSIVNLIVALALMGGLWVATVRVLAASFRHTEASQADQADRAQQAAAPKHAGLANRLHLAPTRGRAVDEYSVADLSATRDRPA